MFLKAYYEIDRITKETNHVEMQLFKKLWSKIYASLLKHYLIRSSSKSNNNSNFEIMMSKNKILRYL